MRLSRIVPLFAACLAVLCAVPGSGQVPTVERNALIDFYTATGGASWSDSTGWLGPPGTECSWFGVTCSLSPPTAVEGLVLPSNNLTGQLPPSIGDLAELRNLDLSGNRLNGELPAEICSLTGLLHLRLGGNRLSGYLPNCLSNLTSLIDLFLEDNAFHGMVRSSIGSLVNLAQLHLDGNRLGGPLPVELTSLTNLVPGGLRLEYNALYSGNLGLTLFLEAHDPGWSDTQTLAPTGVTDVSRTACSVVLQWDPVAYTADPGGYWVWYNPSGGEPDTRYPVPVLSKDVTRLRVTGLSSITTYAFAVTSYTDPHPFNRNTVESFSGAFLSATTGIVGTLNTDMDGDPAPSHEDLGYLLLFFFYDYPITSADPNCDGVANAADLATLIGVLSP